MRTGMRWGLGVAILLLGTGCAAARGFAPDVLPQHDIPQNHPPDGLITARETQGKTEKAIRIAYMKAAPVIDWALLGLMVALQPYGSFSGVTKGLCTVGPSCQQPSPRIP